MLKPVSVAGCPRCGGQTDEAVQAGELLRCIECGYRIYADKMPAPGGKGTFDIYLPYVGGKSERRQQRVVARITGGEKIVSLRVSCPFCPPPAREMECKNFTRQHWGCAEGHSIHLSLKGREFIGWT